MIMKKNPMKWPSAFLRKSLGILSIAVSMALPSNAQLPNCDTKTCGLELIRNGDFQSGNQSFGSEFHLIGSPYPGSGRNYQGGDCQIYTVAPSARALHNQWFTRYDHTSGDGGGGNFFIGDAQCNGQLKKAWFQKVKVYQGKTYAFQAWASNLDNQYYSNMAVFTITDKNGVVITTSAPITSKGEAPEGRWSSICGTYTALQTDSVEIEIKVVPSIPSAGLSGADFGLDDISFKAVSPGSAKFDISRKSTCNNEFVTFKATTLTGVHSWDFGSADATPTTSNGAIAHTIYTKPGTFTVTHTISAPNTDCVETQTFSITVTDCPVSGCNSQLDECGANLITNAGFESGNTGFTSDLIVVSPGFGACTGKYAVANSAVTYTGTDNKHSTWATATDHTSSTGKFLIGDPPCTSDGVSVWKQTVSVAANAVYNFSAWVSNLCSSNNVPSIALRVNGNLVLNPTPIQYSSVAGQKWTKLCGSFTAAQAGSAVLEIEIGPSADAAVAADFGLDDISFNRLGKADATFTAASRKICAGTATTFAAAQSTGVNHSWSFGDGQTSSSATPAVTYNLSGTYTVTHSVTDPATGCTATSTQTITIENCCSVTANFTSKPGQDPNTCEIFFTDNSTYSVETGAIDSWTWSFIDNDGTVTTSTTQNPSHQFNGPGPHNVCLKVTGAAGGENCNNEVCQQVNSPCSLPDCKINANFDWTEILRNTSIPETEELQFNDHSTFSGTQTANNATYVWNFTNTTASSSPYEVGEKNPSRTFNVVAGEGKTTVHLTITSTNGDLKCQGTYCQIIDLKTLAGASCGTDNVNHRVGKSTQDRLSSLTELGENTISTFPNPVSSTLNIEVDAKQAGELSIDVVDMNGRIVANITNGNLVSGKHAFIWNPKSENADGLYIIKIGNQNEMIYQKINLIR